ncbi:MAG: NAD(P)-dependent oxidoreductase [Pirellulaceae bacterium]|nr:MAG: NAD(P)-dependent oxidoreductase [Pirellulaceae bacterium]
MRWLITGASGQLGSYLLRELRRAGVESVTAWTGKTSGQLFGYQLLPVPLDEPQEVARVWRETRPEVVIHAAAISRVQNCYQEPRRAFQVNVSASGQLAQLAVQHGARFVYVSTDLVFDGDRGDYREDDVPRPLSVYGSTKLAAERCVRQYPTTLVARVSLLFGPSLQGRETLFDQQMRSLRAGQSIVVFSDEFRTPLFLADAAKALIQLAQSEATGIWHLGGPERLSRAEMGAELARFLGAPMELVHAIRSEDLFPEPRPRDVSLDSRRFAEAFPEVKITSFSEALPQAVALYQEIASQRT